MRYCLSADTRVATSRGTLRIGDVLDARPNSDNDVDLDVLDRLGRPVHASKFFHSGEHPTLRLRTREGFELTGTHNHPVLCLVNVAGIPTLLWKLLEEIVPGDRVVMQRVAADEIGELDVHDLEALRRSVLGEMVGARSAGKFVPSFVWAGPAAVKRAFLRSLFEGDGSSSLLPRNTVQIAYSTRSKRLAAEVQQLLLEFGVVSCRCRCENGEFQVVITDRRDA